MIWIGLALLGAVFTSLTTIFAKIGIKNVKTNFATFYRTGIVIIGSLILCTLTRNIKLFFNLNFTNYLFLFLSGIATGCSWLCYYKALQLANVNKVAPIDKSSFILTTILFLIFFYNDTTNNGNHLTIIMLLLSMILMFTGTLLMITKQPEETVNSKKWLLYAILSAIFAAIVSLFVKIGLQGIPSDIGTLLRTIIVFIFAGAITFIKKEHKDITKINKNSWIFLTFSGIATGCSWLLEYFALNYPNANPVAVNSIGKMSILLTMIFSALILKEKFSKKTLLGLSLLILGIILIVIFSL